MATLRTPLALDAALQWLLDTSCSAPTAGEAIAALTRQYQLQLLDWIEALPPANRPQRTGTWAAFLLDRNPDIVDRLLPLLQWSISDEHGPATT